MNNEGIGSEEFKRHAEKVSRIVDEWPQWMRVIGPVRTSPYRGGSRVKKYRKPMFLYTAKEAKEDSVRARVKGLSEDCRNQLNEILVEVKDKSKDPSCRENNLIFKEPNCFSSIEDILVSLGYKIDRIHRSVVLSNDSKEYEEVVFLSWEPNPNDRS